MELSPNDQALGSRLIKYRGWSRSDGHKQQLIVFVRFRTMPDDKTHPDGHDWTDYSTSLELASNPNDPSIVGSKLAVI
ncbi:hypothetical protein BH09PSE3_BH09PSE3_14320 [soil metagenome]